MASATATSIVSKKNVNSTKTTSFKRGTNIAAPITHVIPNPKNHALESTITHVFFGTEIFTLHLEDGRSVSVPYYWYPFLAVATSSEREAYTIEGADTVWWNALDDGITLQGIWAIQPDVSRHAVEWRKQRGYAWLDAWVEQRMTNEERTLRNEQLRFLHSTLGAPRTTPNLYERHSAEHLLPAPELLATLALHGIKISKQRLHQLTRGFLQKKGGKTYTIAPVLEQGRDWLDINGKIRYTEHGMEYVRQHQATFSHVSQHQ